MEVISHHLQINKYLIYLLSLFNYCCMSLEQPNPISFEEHIFDFSFHPNSNIIAVGLINGQVQWYITNIR